MVRSVVGRMDKNFWLMRKQHKESLSKALNGLNISDIEIDRLYMKKLKGINLSEEFRLK